MKEIDELKNFSITTSAFRIKYGLYDPKLQKEYGDEFFESIIKDLDYDKETISILKLWICTQYFDAYLKKIIDRIKERIDDNMSSPSAPTYKTENLTSTIKEIIQLNINFTSLETQFGRVSRVKHGALVKSSFEKIGISDGNVKFTGRSILEVFYNFFVKFQKSDGRDLLNHLKGLSDDNLLSELCHLTANYMLNLIDFLSRTYPKYYDEKELVKFIKKKSKGGEEITNIKRGRPTKPENTYTLRNIWNDEKRSFENVVEMLLKPNVILDSENGFLVKDNEKLIWQAIPSGCHVKYIQGFLLFCHKNKFIKLEEYTSRSLQSIFEKTFHLRVNNKSMISKNILEIEEKYCRPFS